MDTFTNLDYYAYHCFLNGLFSDILVPFPCLQYTDRPCFLIPVLVLVYYCKL